MKIEELKRSNIKEINICELPERELIGSLLLEQTIKSPGDILVLNDKSYITVEKVNHYFFDGAKYQFAKTVLFVRPLENFY